MTLSLFICLVISSLRADTQALKAVVGEEALSAEERRFLEFEQNFEKKFLAQSVEMAQRQSVCVCVTRGCMQACRFRFAHVCLLLLFCVQGSLRQP